MSRAGALAWVDDTLFRPDGLALSPGVAVYRPSGEPWGLHAVPEQPTNLAFGEASGKVLFIWAQTSLDRVTLSVPGKPRGGDPAGRRVAARDRFCYLSRA